MKNHVRTLLLFLAAVAVAPLGLADVAPPVRADSFHGRGGGAWGRQLMGAYSFRLTPAVSFAPFYDGTGGRDSGILTAPRQDILRVGTLTLDPKGTVSGHTIATTDDGTTTVVVDFTFSGTYSLNADGTGTLRVATVDVTDASCTPAQAPGECATFEGPETYAFVVNRHGEEKALGLIQTDNEGGGAKVFLTGEALRR
jgi:hypothetical protein